jgi:hypothetical protein
MSVGIDHQVRQGVRLNFDTFFENSNNEFRSIDLNAPINGVRPDLTVGRTLLVQSIGRTRRAGFNVDLNYSPRQGIFSSLRYGFSANMNDADDALTPPASGTFETEWAPTREGRHRLNWNLGLPITRWGVFASINGRLNSGPRYNMTTGFDNNGDAIFNDRPAGVGRNTLIGDFTTQTDMRLSWTIPSNRPNANVNFQRGPGGGGGQGPRPGGGPGGRGGGNQPQRRFEMYLFATNLLNRVNRSSYVGVQNSRLFGQATSAQAARRVELGWRFNF